MNGRHGGNGQSKRHSSAHRSIDSLAEELAAGRQDGGTQCRCVLGWPVTLDPQRP